MKKFLIFSVIFSLLAISCNKSTDFGNELIDDSNIPYTVIDTTILSMESVPNDPVRVYVKNNNSLTPINFLVGKVNDPDFGQIDAEIYVNFIVASIFHGNLNTAEIDSITWTLYYDNDTTHTYKLFELANANLDVFKITQDLSTIDTTYLSDAFDIESIPSASVDNYAIKNRTSDSSNLVFKMNDNFINFIKSLPDSTFSSSAKLNERFEGFCIRARENTNGLIPLNLTHEKNELKIFYKNSGNTTQDSLILKTSNAAFRHHHITTNIEGTPLAQHYSNPAADTIAFLQSLGGPNLKITLPELSELKDHAINFAELELTLVNDQHGNFKKPDRIFIFKKNSNGTLIAIDDCLTAIQNDLYDAFGGTPEEFTIGGQTIFKYKFRIPQYMTKYLDGKESGELYLSALYGNHIPARVLFKSPLAQEKSIGLKLIVTKQY